MYFPTKIIETLKGENAIDRRHQKRNLSSEGSGHEDMCAARAVEVDPKRIPSTRSFRNPKASLANCT